MSHLVLMIDALVSAGASPEMIAAAVRAVENDREQKEQQRLERQAERTRKSRALKNLSRDVTGSNVTDSDTPLQAVTERDSPPPKEASPTPPKETTPPNLASLGVRFAGARFLEFMAIYPKRIEKKAAEAKFITAVKSGVDPEQIIDGARRYAESVRGTDPQYIKSPVVWLNRGCWDDEDLLPPVRAGPVTNGHAEKRSKPLAAFENLRERFSQDEERQSDLDLP